MNNFNGTYTEQDLVHYQLSFFKMGEMGILLYTLVLCTIGSTMGNTGCIPGTTCPPSK